VPRLLQPVKRAAINGSVLRHVASHPMVNAAEDENCFEAMKRMHANATSAAAAAAAAAAWQGWGGGGR